MKKIKVSKNDIFICIGLTLLSIMTVCMCIITIDIDSVIIKDKCYGTWLRKRCHDPYINVEWYMETEWSMNINWEVSID